MGLLDQFLSQLGLQAPNLDDPKTLGLLTAGLQMMSPTPVKMNTGGQVAQGLLGGVNAYGVGRQAQLKQEADERANRANDLQQLTGLQSALYANDFPRAMQEGANYKPSPELAAVNQRIRDLVMKSNMTSGVSASQPAPLTAPPSSTPAPMPAQSPAQNFSGANPSFDPSMLPQQPVAPSTSPASPTMGAGGQPLAAWMMAGRAGPGAMAFLQQYAKERAPQNVRPGGSLAQLGPDGQYHAAFYAPQLGPGVMPQRDAAGNLTGASEVPGYAGAAANIQGQSTAAKEAAAFPFKYTEVQQAGGGKVPMPLSALFAPKSQFVAAPPLSGAPGAASSSPNVAELTVTQPSKQSATDPWADIPKRPVPSGLGETTYNAERQKKYAEQTSALSDSLGSASDAANQRIAFNNEGIKVLKSANTGTLAQQISGVGKLLITMGVPEKLVNTAGMDPTATDELNKFLINSATQKAKSIYGPRLAQQEVMMQVNQASPSLGMTKAAIQTLLNLDNAMAGYTIKQANDFGAYDAKGGDPSRFMAWYARKFPMAKELDLTQAPQPASQSKPTLQDIEAEILRRRQGQK